MLAELQVDGYLRGLTKIQFTSKNVSVTSDKSLAPVTCIADWYREPK